jgi:hypothetical protein
MTIKLVPTIYFNIGDSFLFPDGSVVRVVGIDRERQTYDLRGKYLMDIRDFDQDNLRSMLNMGTIKLLNRI